VLRVILGVGLDDLRIAGLKVLATRRLDADNGFGRRSALRWRIAVGGGLASSVVGAHGGGFVNGSIGGGGGIGEGDG
jgi:hypothetical protein